MVDTFLKQLYLVLGHEYLPPVVRFNSFVGLLVSQNGRFRVLRSAFWRFGGKILEISSKFRVRVSRFAFAFRVLRFQSLRFLTFMGGMGYIMNIALKEGDPRRLTHRKFRIFLNSLRNFLRNFEKSEIS